MLALHDFYCSRCEGKFEEFSAYNDTVGRIDPQECPACGALCERIWLKAPGVKSDEKIPKELGRPHGKTFETRHELDAYIKKNDLVPVTGNEASDMVDRSVSARDKSLDGPTTAEEKDAYAAKKRDGIDRITSMMWKQKDGLLPPARSPKGTETKLAKAGVNKGASE